MFGEQCEMNEQRESILKNFREYIIELWREYRIECIKKFLEDYNELYTLLLELQ